MENPLSRVIIKNWTGLVSNRGPYQGRPGDAKVQVNVRSMQPGVLETRNGFRLVKFRS